MSLRDTKVKSVILRYTSIGKNLQYLTYGTSYGTMILMGSKKQELYQAAKNSPNNIKFSDLCNLAEAVGFKFRRFNGGHKIYKHEKMGNIMTFQPDKGDKSKAKAYQVRQLVEFIEEYDLLS